VAVGYRRPATLGLGTLRRNKGLDFLPERIGQQCLRHTVLLDRQENRFANRLNSLAQLAFSEKRVLLECLIQIADANLLSAFANTQRRAARRLDLGEVDGRGFVVRLSGIDAAQKQEREDKSVGGIVTHRPAPPPADEIVTVGSFHRAIRQLYAQ